MAMFYERYEKVGGAFKLIIIRVSYLPLTCIRLRSILCHAMSRTQKEEYKIIFFKTMEIRGLSHEY